MAGPLAAARDADDDSRAVAEPREHEPGAAGVLRVPLVADGAVGRPGLDRLHRRHGDRRGARPQRPAAVALLRDQGRPRGHGVRGRRARHSRRRTSCVKERLQPGRMFLVDTAQGRIIDDEEIKEQLAARAARTREWLAGAPDRASRTCPTRRTLPPPDHETVLRRQQAFGYTHEDSALLLGADGDGRRGAVGSMGTDTPLAVLSDRPQLLYNYFKQLFAQVTNPPLDAIREELVTSMESTIGPERNLLRARAGVVPADQRSAIRSSTTISSRSCGTSTSARASARSRCRCCSDAARGRRRRSSARWSDLQRAGERRPSRDGDTILILSDRGVDARSARRFRACWRRPACTIIWSARARARAAGWSSRSGDAREVHHFALLIGYGAGAVNPYLAFETLDDMIAPGHARGRRRTRRRCRTTSRRSTRACSR